MKGYWHGGEKEGGTEGVRGAEGEVLPWQQRCYDAQRPD